MATMIVKMRVANFERWKADFESMRGARADHGWISHRVVRDVSDPNVVTVISRVRALARAKQYGQSPELREAFQRSGVQGPAEVSFCEDDTEGDYPGAARPEGSVKLYVFPRSTSSRPVLLFCAEAKIPFEAIVIDLMAGSQHQEPLRSLNPGHTVPVLVDGDFVLTESSAIMKYLADKHGSSAYPKEPQKRARIHERMDWIQANFLPEWTQHLIYPQVLPTHKRTPEAAQTSLLQWGKEKSERLLAVLDASLIGPNEYVCGTEISLADYLAAEAVWSGTLIGARFGAYPNIERWLGAMRALPSWAKINEGVDHAATAMKGRSFVTVGG